MNSVGKVATSSFFVIVLCSACMLHSEALAQSSYFREQGCTGCHAAPVVDTCNGCHSHGTHPNSGKDAVNVAGTTDKSSYTPGETVSVTITGGYRNGWLRAVLYDQNMVELARSAGNGSGEGGSATYPVVLSAPAPAKAGTYTWNVAWYGNKFDASGATFGPGWTLDTKNPNHGFEIVAISAPFTVAAIPPPTPAAGSTAVDRDNQGSPDNNADENIATKPAVKKN